MAMKNQQERQTDTMLPLGLSQSVIQGAAQPDGVQQVEVQSHLLQDWLWDLGKAPRPL